MEITAVGFSYTDEFPTFLRDGGIHNFPGPKKSIGDAYCYYDALGNKKSEFVGIPTMPPRYIKLAHIMYGDKLEQHLNFFENDNFNFLSVDFSAKFKLISPEILGFWAKRANIIFAAIEDDQLYDDFEWDFRYGDLILHCAKGVYYQCEGKSGVVLNPYVDYKIRDTLGAGDVFSYHILSNWPVTKTNIKRAMKKTYEYLKEKNKCQNG